MNPVVDLPEPLLLGLHALVALAKCPDECLSSRSIAETLGGSEGHLAKVLQKLTRAGYLESLHGPGGGYRLLKAPQDINMLDVFTLLGGPFVMDGCGFAGCRGRSCLIGSLVDGLTLAIQKYLGSKNLKDLLMNFDKAPEIEIGVRLEENDPVTRAAPPARADSR